jgi:two-component system sensor histidine kinase CpxA
VSGDPELLASCFENVIRNAVRHTHADTAVEITVSYENDFRQFCRIDIRDRGDGVPEAELEQIFEPFYRLEGGASPGSGRSGIGLAIARRAVHRHGGEIVAANAPGGGLEVSVTLPVAGPRTMVSAP